MMLKDAYCRRHICNLTCHGLSDRLAERIAFDIAYCRAGAGNRCGNCDRVAKADTKVRNDRQKTTYSAAAAQIAGRRGIRSHYKINTRIGSRTKTETQVEKTAETQSG